MDLTKSMREAKQKLQDAAVDISNQLKALTSSYTIGFGAFSDKPTVPFSEDKSSYYHDCGVVCGKVPTFGLLEAQDCASCNKKYAKGIFFLALSHKRIKKR